MGDDLPKPAQDALEMIDYRGNPSVLVIADGVAAAKACSAADLADARVIDVVAPAGGFAQLGRQIGPDAILLRIEGEGEEHLDRLVDEIGKGVEDGRFGAVIELPSNLLDGLGARALAYDIGLLCEPTDGERAAALRLAATRPPLRLHDVNKAQATVRLQQLSEEVGRIATVLQALSEDEAAAQAVASVRTDEGERERIEPGQIRAIIRARRLRDHFFKSELFADPAWDMLLDLMAARAEKQKVAVSSLCIAAAVPPTTALRWIKTLCDQGLFVRVADPEDGRRVFIELSDEPAEAMEAYLRSAQRIAALIV